MSVQVRCARCRVELQIPQEGAALPRHLDRLRLPCSGTRAESIRAVSAAAPTASPSVARTPAGQTSHPSSSESPTPEERRERKLERKRRDRIEQAYADLSERAPSDDIEFGPGRRGDTYGGLSHANRRRY